MKKRIISIVVLILIVSIAVVYFRNKGGDVNNVKRMVTISEVYSEQDINKAK